MSGRFLRSLRTVLVGVVVLAMAAVAGWYWLADRVKPVTELTPMDPVQDLGYREATIPSSGQYSFVYMLEESPQAFHALPLFGEAQRLFTFNPETKAVHVTKQAPMPINTQLMVGSEAVSGDFLLDSQFLHAQGARLTVRVRPLSIIGRVVKEGQTGGSPMELINNDARPLGIATIEALTEGRVRISWGSETQELTPGETWVVEGKGASQKSRLAFANLGLWPLKAVTVLHE